MSRTGTWAPRMCVIVKMLLGFCPSPVKSSVRSASGDLGPWRRTMAPHGRVVSYSLFRLFSMSSCEVVRWRLHLEIGIRFSPLYPRFNGVSNTDRGAWRCASCRSSRINSLFCVRWFDFRLDSFDLWLPSLFIVAALVCQSFGALERWFYVSLL
jgi:hypothetical protein